MQAILMVFFWGSPALCPRSVQLCRTGASARTTGRILNSYLLESTLNFLRRNYVFTCLELVDKDELFPEAPVHPAYRIGAYTFGGVRDLVHNPTWQLGVGADVTFYSKPSVLDTAYGDNPVSFQVFLRVRPGLSHHHP